jgi:hypothetical protein
MICENWHDSMMGSRKFVAGDWAIYQKLEHSECPGAEAFNVSPAPNGDGYSYFILEYWTVQEVLANDRLRLRTPKGKIGLVEASDPNLRRIAWWKRWIHMNRFREVKASTRQEP